MVSFLFFKQKTAYELRISDWSSDVCSSDLRVLELYAALTAPSALSIISRVELEGGVVARPEYAAGRRAALEAMVADRKNGESGKRELVRVDTGGRRIMKKKQTITNTKIVHTEKS